MTSARMTCELFCARNRADFGLWAPWVQPWECVLVFCVPAGPPAHCPLWGTLSGVRDIVSARTGLLWYATF